MSIKTPFQVLLGRLPPRLHRLLEPAPVVFKHYVPEGASKQQMQRLSEAQRETFLNKDSIYENKTEDFFFRQYILPDGRQAKLIIQDGVEQWFVEEEEEVAVTEQFVAAYLVMEHGWASGYDVWLSQQLIDYYAGEGDPVCPSGKDHFYGVVTEAEPCDFGFGHVWDDALPVDGAPALALSLEGGSETVVSSFFANTYRDPALYSGLLRQTAQAMGSLHDITIRLLSAQFGALNPQAFGIVRDYDGTRLAYWLVKVTSSGVGMLKLGWPIDMASTAAAVLTGEVNGETLTPDERTRYETLLLSRLTTKSNINNTEPSAIVVVTEQQHISAIGEPGFAFLDGHPFFAPQPWGSGNESNARCILTDIRKRFDLGTSNADPWEMATTLEYSFQFDSEGTPTCSLTTLHKDKWWPRGATAPYAYFDNQAQKICVHHAFSLAGSESHTDAVVAAWYDANGNRVTLKQLKRQTTSVALNESSSDVGLGIVGIPEGDCGDYSENPRVEGCESSAYRYKNIEDDIDTWVLQSSEGTTRLEGGKTTFDEIFEREIVTDKKHVTTWQKVNPYTHSKLGGGLRLEYEKCPTVGSSCAFDVLQPLCSSLNVPDAYGENRYPDFWLSKIDYYSLGDSYENYKKLNNGFMQNTAIAMRPGKSRDAVCLVKHKLTMVESGLEERWVPPEDGGYAGVRKYYSVVYYPFVEEDEREQVWVGEYALGLELMHVLPHSHKCGTPWRQDHHINDGTDVEYSTYITDNMLSRMEWEKVWDNESTTEQEGSLVAPGYSSRSLTDDEVDTLFHIVDGATRMEPCQPLMTSLGIAVSTKDTITNLGGGVNKGPYPGDLTWPGRFVGSV